MRRFGRRTAVVVAAAALGMSVPAGAAGPPVASYTGCLQASGQLVLVAESTKPVGGSCPSGTRQVWLSAGDITQVDTPADGGLQSTDGASSASGTAALSLQTDFRLPQGCQIGQVPAKQARDFLTGQPRGWRCTTVDGSRFALSNRTCPPGQYQTGVDTAGAPRCAPQQAAASNPGYQFRAPRVDLPFLVGTEVARLDLPPGAYLVMASFELLNRYNPVIGLSERYVDCFLGVDGDSANPDVVHLSMWHGYEIVAMQALGTVNQSATLTCSTNYGNSTGDSEVDARNIRLSAIRVDGFTVTGPPQ